MGEQEHLLSTWERAGGCSPALILILGAVGGGAGSTGEFITPQSSSEAAGVGDVAACGLGVGMVKVREATQGTAWFCLGPVGPAAEPPPHVLGSYWVETPSPSLG